jgi:hypothetical protein
MAQENYAKIPVTVGVFDRLKRRKLNRQAELGKEITWDEFLLDVTNDHEH